VFGDEIGDRGISSVVLFNYINNLVNFTGGGRGTGIEPSPRIPEQSVGLGRALG